MDPSYVCPPSVKGLEDLEYVYGKNMYILTAYVSSPHPQCKSQKLSLYISGFYIDFILIHPLFLHLHSIHSSKLQSPLHNSRHDSRPEHRQRKKRGYS